MINGLKKDLKSKLRKKSNATLLVRDLLGCTCPSEIFDHYQVQEHISENIPTIQMIMGNRLLVRIVDSAKLNDPQNAALRLLKEGHAERERRRLNRFRLVIIGGFSPIETHELEELPKRFDDKVHLHILTSIESALD